MVGNQILTLDGITLACSNTEWGHAVKALV